ncbi:MAG: hypothetical protein U0531_00955 [Dehalococcoidia bacterium]
MNDVTGMVRARRRVVLALVAPAKPRLAELFQEEGAIVVSPAPSPSHRRPGSLAAARLGRARLAGRSGPAGAGRTLRRRRR